jgi:hypothetical protein
MMQLHTVNFKILIIVTDIYIQLIPYHNMLHDLNQ